MYHAAQRSRCRLSVCCVITNAGRVFWVVFIYPLYTVAFATFFVNANEGNRHIVNPLTVVDRLVRMGRFQECRGMVELVLRMDPDMPSARTLHKAVQEAAARRSEWHGIFCFVMCCCVFVSSGLALDQDAFVRVRL